MKPRFPPRLIFLCLALGVQTGLSAEPRTGNRSGHTLSAVEREFASSMTPMFERFCSDCHGDKKAKGQINLQRMGAEPDFAGLFKSWEKVIAMLEEREMPPEDEPQPSDSERRKIIDGVREALERFIRQEAGDPGRIVMRQLTSAEYACTIQDLTGLDLGLERNFVSDAVGGEGFSNVGDVQFIQDSTLERYLEAAKIIASHATIGAGPLRFFRDPGKTGQELSAIGRIQEVYRQHGFRTAAGEGGKAFGLERYPRAFHAAWRFQHRRELGLEDASLATLARDEGVEVRFLEYIWETINRPSLSFPSSEIAEAWRKLPAPKTGDRQAGSVRAECANLFKLLQAWQTTFAENTGDAEAGMGETSFRPSMTNSFRVRLSWPAGTTNAAFEISVSAVGDASAKPAVLWRQPNLRFRKRGDGAGGARGRPPGRPLKEIVSEASAQRVQFGRGLSGDMIGTNDFVTLGSAVLPIEFSIPDGMTQAELTMDAQLDLAHGDDCVARCVVSHQLSEGETVAATGTFSALLANPGGANMGALKAGVAEFAGNFPQSSHREAAPSDRDPIPAPFDTSYNNPERNDFHYIIKYHRDDRFLTENILGDATRAQLDQAWADLLTSFDYHNTFLRFVARKYRFDLGDRSVANLRQDWIDGLPDEPRQFVKTLHEQHASAQRTLQAAQSGHVEDALRFAQLAWRRPLSEPEKDGLRIFYGNMRRESGLDHPDALRALLARVLVAPGFLYRIESMGQSQIATGERVALSDWELASRLSYFLWSSIPDAELSRAAAAGELKSSEQLARQAERMLHDPKARRFATEFFGQWFGFYRFDGYRGVDTGRFPEFTEALKTAMYDEAVSFFDFIIRRDRPVQEILFADYSFLNRDLAQHYGIDATPASTNKLMTMTEGVNRFHRGGLLRLGAVLTSTSAPLRTSAVKRGDWMLRRVLGRSVPPPPGDAGSIAPDDVLDDGKTVRQRLEAHRRDASCVNCHSRMDPLGFALEHFDSIGRWRDTYRDGQKIDATGTLNDGTQIAEFEGLIQYLRNHEASFNRTLCAKLLGYALGRAELVSDRPLLQQMTAGLNNDKRFSSLVGQIVTSPQFRYRRAQAPGLKAQ